MKRLITSCLLVLCFLSSNVIAQDKTTTIVFVNGIQNTYAAAMVSRDTISRVLRDSTNRANSAKRVFQVRLVWNPIGFYGTGDGQWD